MTSTSFCAQIRASSVLTPSKRTRMTRASVRPAAYSITVKMPAGEATFDCPPGKYIIEAASNAGIELPNLCRNGTCCTCAVKIESGTADCSETNYLDEDQLAKGFMLVCSAKATSDMVLLSHQEDNIWG